MDTTYCPVHDIECGKIKDLEIETKKMVTFKVLSILVAIFCIMTGGIYGVLSTQLSDHISRSNKVLKELSDRQHTFNVNQRLIMHELNVKDPD